MFFDSKKCFFHFHKYYLTHVSVSSSHNWHKLKIPKNAASGTIKLLNINLKTKHI